jgi:hypothetical protein
LGNSQSKLLSPLEIVDFFNSLLLREVDENPEALGPEAPDYSKGREAQNTLWRANNEPMPRRGPSLLGFQT